MQFRKAILDDVQTRVYQTHQEVEQYKLQELEHVKDQELEKIFQKMQADVQKIKRSVKEQLSNQEMDMRKELLLRRKQIADEIFTNVSIRLHEFVESDAYLPYLIETLKKRLKTNTLSEWEILLLERDMRYQEAITQVFGPDCRIAMDPAMDAAVQIGGFRLRNLDKGLIVDETFAEKLAAERQAFLGNQWLAAVLHEDEVIGPASDTKTAVIQK